VLSSFEIQTQKSNSNRVLCFVVVGCWFQKKIKNTMASTNSTSVSTSTTTANNGTSPTKRNTSHVSNNNTAEIEETLARIRSHKGVEGILVMTKDGKFFKYMSGTVHYFTFFDYFFSNYYSSRILTYSLMYLSS